MKRRSFLKAAGGGALAAPAVVAASQASAEPDTVAGMPRRTLGRTGRKVSIVGFPGLALTRYEQDEGTAAIQDAYRRGVNYFDVAPAYGKGDAEIKMGIGLEGIKRDSIFLACKTKMRDKQGAKEELERSLEHLKTDHFDLYQLHCLIRPEEVDEALGPGGAMETILDAQRQGTIGHIGFSAHTTKAGLKALQSFPFDTVMFPISFVEYFMMGFGKPILEQAVEQGTPVLAIKGLCRGSWPEGMERTRKCWYRPVEDDQEVDMALRFTLSQKPVAAAIPPSWFDVLDKALDAAKSYRPITDAETDKLRKLSATCESLFREQEDQVAHHRPYTGPIHPDSPHECCPGEMA